MSTEKTNTNEPEHIKGQLTCSVCKGVSWLILSACLIILFVVVKPHLQIVVGAGRTTGNIDNTMDFILIGSGIVCALLLRVLATIGENLIEINQRNKK